MPEATRELDRRAVALLVIALGMAALIAALWLSLRTVHGLDGEDCGSVFERLETDDEGVASPKQLDASCDYARSQAGQLPIALGVMGAGSIVGGVVLRGRGEPQR